MKKFEVSTDSTCDLYASEIDNLGIYVGHLSYIIDKGGDITEHTDDFKSYQEYVDFYNTLRSGAVAKTSILNVDFGACNNNWFVSLSASIYPSAIT